MLRSLQWQNDIYKAYIQHSLKITISFREKYKAFIKKSVLMSGLINLGLSRKRFTGL